MPIRHLYFIAATLIISLFCLSQFSLKQRVVSHVLQTIQQKSLDDVSYQSLYEGALRGMTEVISDHPYTSYIPPAREKSYEQELQGQVAGVGVFNLLKEEESGEFTFIPVYNAPVDRQGLRFGDKIVAVEGESVKNFSLWELASRLRGEVGTSVVLTIRPRELPPETQLGTRASCPHPPLTENNKETSQEVALKEVTIIRNLFQQEIVFGDRRKQSGEWEFRLETAPDIGYIAVSQFTDTTVGELFQALESLQRDNVTKLVIDFRGNPGGFLPAAVTICDQFLAQGDVIVTTRHRDGRIKKEYTATGKGKYSLPSKKESSSSVDLVLLIDGDSASASEIVAATLQDHHRATVIGTRSYGKGTIQELFSLPCQMGLLRLTDASFWRPSNQPLHRYDDSKPEDEWGVKPNEGFEVPLPPFQRAVVRIYRDLRRSLRSDDLQGAIALQRQNIDSLIQRVCSINGEKGKKILETYLGTSLDIQGEKQEKEDTLLPLRSTDFAFWGNAPYFDPQLDLAIKFLEEK